MNRLLDILTRHRNLALALVFASAAILSFAYVSQYVFHYDPCILCLYQRKPYFAVIVLGMAAFFLQKRHPRTAFFLLLLCGASFLIGAGVAGYHTGVEQGWWKGTQACGDALLPQNATIDELREYLRNKRVTRCDVPSWTFLGFSMTNYNLVQSLLLAALTFWLSLRGQRQAG